MRGMFHPVTSTGSMATQGRRLWGERVSQTQMGAGVATSPHSSAEECRRGGILFGDRFRPRPFGPGRFRRGSASPEGFAKFRYAVRPSEDFRSAAFPLPEGSGPALDSRWKVGSARSGFRLPALRASSSKPSLPAAALLHPFLRTSSRFAAVAVAGCFAIRFRFAALPATQTS